MAYGSSTSNAQKQSTAFKNGNGDATVWIDLYIQDTKKGQLNSYLATVGAIETQICDTSSTSATP